MFCRLRAAFTHLELSGLIPQLRCRRTAPLVLIARNYHRLFKVRDRITSLHFRQIGLNALTTDRSEEELIRIVKPGLSAKAITAKPSEAPSSMRGRRRCPACCLRLHTLPSPAPDRALASPASLGDLVDMAVVRTATAARHRDAGEAPAISADRSHLPLLV